MLSPSVEAVELVVVERRSNSLMNRTRQNRSLKPWQAKLELFCEGMDTATRKLN